MTLSPRFALQLGFVVLCLGMIAGCGDDDDGNATPVPQPTVTATPPLPTSTPPPTSTQPPATPTPSASLTATEEATPSPTLSDNPVLNLPVDETIVLPGLTETVDVAFDSLGIPHMYGPDRRSVLFMQGYQTAAARFWMMDAFRRVAEGRLSEIFGPLTVDSDIEMRTVFTTRDGRRIEEALWEHLQQVAPDEAALLQAYADGVNAWLADLRANRNGATLPPEYTFFMIKLRAKDLDDWRPQDTLAIGRLQAFDLSSTLSEEIAAAEELAVLPEAVFLDAFRSAPAAPATVLPRADAMTALAAGRGAAAAPSPALPPLEVLRDVRRMLERNARFDPLNGAHGIAGSNNWIVAPQLSTSGHAMLANDPHLQLFNPPIWHVLQLDAGQELRVNGVMFPGLPGVILGHNDRGAWGGTVAAFDVTDIYTETVTTPPDYPTSPRTVLFNGEQVPVLRIEEQIHIKGGDSVPAIIEVVPHHGPMVPDPDPNDDVDGLAATNMSFRWTGHEITLDSLFILDINRAGNVQEFKQAVRKFAVGAQNWIWADVSGDIAYFPYVLIPQRPRGTVPYLPMDGTGTAEWLHDDAGNTLWLPEEKIPQAVNPTQGFLATANNDQIGNTLDNDPLNDEIYLFFTADIGFREQRVQDLLSNRAGVRPQGTGISLDDMSSYQYDMVSLEASRLVPFLHTAAANRPDLVTPAMTDALARIQEWGTEKQGSSAWDARSGVDPADLRTDVPPRTMPVTDEEKADAVATSIYAAWSTRVAQATFADDFDDTALAMLGGDFGTKTLLHILEDIDRTDPGFVVHTKGPNGESTLWDDRNTPEIETRDEILLRSLQDALTFLEDQFGSSSPEDWLWGKIHQVRFQHFLGQAGITGFDLGNFPAPGARQTVNPANYSLLGDSFIFSHGPSERFVIDLDPAGLKAFNILPGGENGNPGTISAYNTINPALHYGDHIPGWINGEPFQYRISREEVAADTQKHIRYIPPN
jgi:penicillin G amidase